MSKICVCDLDGVLADSGARFKLAEEAKQAYLAQKTGEEAEISKKRAENLYWYNAFMPDLIRLDTLIDAAMDDLFLLALSAYEVMVMTSRPEHLREATRRWLFEQGYPVEEPLILKPTAFQFTKTPVWKAGTVQLLASLYDASEVLFVDDEQLNRDTLMDAWMAQGESRELIVASSLKDALAKARDDA